MSEPSQQVQVPPEPEGEAAKPGKPSRLLGGRLRSKSRQPQPVRVRWLTGAATIVLVAGATVGTLKVTSGGSTDGAEAAQASTVALTGLPTYASASASPSAAKKATASAAASKLTSTGGASSNAEANSALAAEIKSAEASSSAAGQYVALVHNGSGSAYAFVLDSARTLMYAYQSSTGPGGWTNFVTMPGTPSDLVSEPTAVADKDGHVEVFARDAEGQIVDGWQNSSGGWSWDGAVTGGALPGTPVGSPRAVLRPNGEAQVFTRLSNGKVVTASQKAQNGTTGWTGWTELGGRIAGTPVAFADSDGDVDLFARSTSSTLVADYESGGGWSGWSTVGSSPDNLAHDPLPVANADGTTEVMVSTSTGNMDSAWGKPGSWTWGTPLTGQNLGSAIASSPSGYAWSSDGHLEIFARLANGELAHAWQNEPNGETDWSLWGTLPGSPSGYPTAFVNGDGSPEVLMLTSSSDVEFDYWMSSSSAWSAPITMPGDVG